MCADRCRDHRVACRHTPEDVAIPISNYSSIDWSRLTDAFGTAEGIPELLHGLTLSIHSVVEHSLYNLRDRLCHQGTRFEASAAAIPFLFELLDQADLPIQPEILELIGDIALGSWPADDELLPFRPEVEFAAAQDVSTEEAAAAYRQMMDGSDDCDTELLDAATVLWAREAHAAATACSEQLLIRAIDPNPKTAAWAYALTPWFPAVGARAVALGIRLVAKPTPAPLRTTVLLTLGLLGNPAAVPALLDALRTAGNPEIEVAAAVGLGLLQGPQIDDAALAVLLESERWQAELDAATGRLPFARPLRGYVARALHRVESDLSGQVLPTSSIEIRP